MTARPRVSRRWVERCFTAASGRMQPIPSSDPSRNRSIWSATEVLLHRLDQISLGYLALYYVIAAIVFRLRYRHAESGLERQQLKWLTRGTLLAVIPFTLLNVIPYLADWAMPVPLTKLSG